MLWTNFPWLKFSISQDRYTKHEADNKSIYNSYNCSGIVHSAVHMFNPIV